MHCWYIADLAQECVSKYSQGNFFRHWSNLAIWENLTESRKIFFTLNKYIDIWYRMIIILGK